MRAAPAAAFEAIVRNGAREYFKQRVEAIPAPPTQEAIPHTLTMLYELRHTLDKAIDPARVRRSSGAFQAATLRSRRNPRHRVVRDFLVDFGLVILTCVVITFVLLAIVNDSFVLPQSLRPAKATLAASLNDPAFAAGMVVLLALPVAMAFFFSRQPPLRRWIGRSLGAVSAAAFMSVSGVAYLDALRTEVKINRAELELREVVLFTLAERRTSTAQFYPVASGFESARASDGSLVIWKKTDDGGRLVASIRDDTARLDYTLVGHEPTPRGVWVLGEVKGDGQNLHLVNRNNERWVVKAGMAGHPGQLVFAEVTDGIANPVLWIRK
ncbi:MAG TPA: hypothetical protein VNI54_02885 [Thermoanaerobaculia bacterium]|nr:hypothetical protein [Thermoanaerobaculia bacterium]